MYESSVIYVVYCILIIENKENTKEEKEKQSYCSRFQPQTFGS